MRGNAFRRFTQMENGFICVHLRIPLPHIDPKGVRMPVQQETRVDAKGTILAGGIALIGGALAFLGVFSYLAARFHYPEVLDGSARDVLPALLAAGAAGRAAWALYGVLPLVFISA